MADFLKRDTKTSHGTSVQHVYCLFIAGLAALYRPLILQTLPAWYGVNAFMGPKNLKLL
jgi:hypothetical protein